MIPALGLALLAAIEPLGIIAFIAVLGSRGGRRNTRGFIVGWVLCACVVALATLLVSGGSHTGHVSTTISSAGLLQVALGVTSLTYLVVRRRRDPAALERSDDALVKQDNLGPGGAATIAAAVQGAAARRGRRDRGVGLDVRGGPRAGRTRAGAYGGVARGPAPVDRGAP